MDIDFEKYKGLHYCDNANCKFYEKIGTVNICTLSKSHNQVYCNGCHNRWVLSKGTFFYHLHRPKDLVIQVLLEMSEGKGNRAIERTHGVSRITQKKWIIRAANHLHEIDEYLTANMELTRLQIDEFCGAARAVIHFKKKSILQPMKRQKTQRAWEIGGLS